MSETINSLDKFPAHDPSRDFGRDEGRAGYNILAAQRPDDRIATVAERAVRIGMIVNGRFDVDPKRATQALIDNLFSDLTI